MEKSELLKQITTLRKTLDECVNEIYITKMQYVAGFNALITILNLSVDLKLDFHNLSKEILKESIEEMNKQLQGG